MTKSDFRELYFRIDDGNRFLRDFYYVIPSEACAFSTVVETLRIYVSVANRDEKVIPIWTQKTTAGKFSKDFPTVGIFQFACFDD